MKTTNEYYDRLKELQAGFPGLTFQNNGYEKLWGKVLDDHAEQLKEIDQILTKTIEGFRTFNNFKLRKDGSVVVRVQYAWSPSFTGVGYFPLEDFKDFEIEEEVMGSFDKNGNLI